MYNIDYKPTNKIIKPCEFLVKEKVTQYRENSRDKIVTLMYYEHKCLKSNKIVTIYNDCAECDFYKNYIEIIDQQAEKIKALEQQIGEMNND